MKNYRRINLSFSVSLILAAIILAICMSCEDDDAIPQQDPNQDPPPTEGSVGLKNLNNNAMLFYC
ncbi:hypothetical protein [Spongiivirga citrea]|uniref:Uncharacterized protein n=1 Tax=Spongiivirga citrea TaxID=1481457 RepID=A0A6M0CP66_9FLAO|nr:hypothetical protein [Spongiivirga citrea]NER17267.1 hypothetical protein [Spongiivirga citrea]